MNRYFDVYYNKKTKYPRLLARYLFDRFNMKKGQTLLDVGCGIGEYLDEFELLGLEVYGLDSRPIEDERISECNLEEYIIPCKDNSFDIVFSKSCVEHLSDPYKVISDMKRVLKPGGTLIIMVPDWTSNMKYYYDGYDHKTAFTRRGLRDLMGYVFFDSWDCELFYQLPFMWKHSKLSFIPKIISLLPDRLMWKNYNTHRPLIRFSKLKMVLAWGRK